MNDGARADLARGCVSEGSNARFSTLFLIGPVVRRICRDTRQERNVRRSVKMRKQLMEETMKKLILVGALALMSSGAWAQPSQSQGGAQAGTGGTSSTTPGAMQNGSTGGMTNGTTGMNSGMQTGTKSSGPNGTAGDQPMAKGGPAGSASKDEAAPK